MRPSIEAYSNHSGYFAYREFVRSTQLRLASGDHPLDDQGRFLEKNLETIIPARAARGLHLYELANKFGYEENPDGSISILGEHGQVALQLFGNPLEDLQEVFELAAQDRL